MSVKSCKVHMTSSRKLKKNVHNEDLQVFFFMCRGDYADSNKKTELSLASKL